jgi:hypothetical protein
LDILEQKTVEDFATLVALSGLDPARAFRGADLRGVDFGTDDLSKFNFSGADLRSANLSKATGLALAIFDRAIYDETTIGWPPEQAKVTSIAIPNDINLKKVRSMVLRGEAPPEVDPIGWTGIGVT